MEFFKNEFINWRSLLSSPKEFEDKPIFKERYHTLISKELERHQQEKEQLRQRLRAHYKRSRESKGHCLFINIEKYFKRDRHGWKIRQGSEHDLKLLRTVFEDLDYHIYKPDAIDRRRGTWTKSDINDIVNEFHQECEISEPDSIVIFIGGYGNRDQIFTSDPPRLKSKSNFSLLRPSTWFRSRHERVTIKLEEIVTKFYDNQCPSLKEKPKIFIFNACEYFTESFISDEKSAVSDLVICTVSSPRISSPRDGGEQAEATVFVHTLTQAILKCCQDKTALEIFKMVQLMLEKVSKNGFREQEKFLCLRLFDLGLKNLYF